MVEFFSVEVTLNLMDPLNVPYFHFIQVPLQPSCAHSGLKPHSLTNKLAVVMACGQWSSLQSESFTARNGGPTWPDDFSKPIHAKEERNGLTKGFLQLSPEVAMLPGPSVETCPPPPVPLFLLAQYLSPKDISRCRDRPWYA